MEIRHYGQRTSVGVDFSGTKSRTKQSMRDECDVNLIMRKWRKTGEMEHLSKGPARYGDFTNADDYLLACNRVLEAQAAFDALSSRVRDRMNNNPAELLAFLEDPKNLDEAIELGLVTKPAEKPTEKTAVKEGEPPQNEPSKPPEGGGNS